MAEYTFKSDLSEDEIAENFQNIDFFSGIMSGLEEALAFEKGKAKAATIARKNKLPDINPSEIRKSLNMTQKEFANILGVSPRTVEAWESGRTMPSPTAKILIFLISENPALLSQLK